MQISIRSCSTSLNFIFFLQFFSISQDFLLPLKPKESSLHNPVPVNVIALPYQCPRRKEWPEEYLRCFAWRSARNRQLKASIISSTSASLDEPLSPDQTLQLLSINLLEISDSRDHNTRRTNDYSPIDHAPRAARLASDFAGNFQ